MIYARRIVIIVENDDKRIIRYSHLQQKRRLLQVVEDSVFFFVLARGPNFQLLFTDIVNVSGSDFFKNKMMVIRILV